MGRAGRKRKAGKRHPSGQLVRTDKTPDDRVRAGRQPHRRGVRADDRLDERAESPLGRLSLQRDDEDKPLISDDQYNAGTLYAVIVGKYRSLIEAPRGTAGSGRGVECSALCRAAHELLSARQREDVHDGLFNTETCRCLARKWSYEAAFEALIAEGQRAAKVVARVAVHREDIAPQDLVYLDVGLAALARHFGLTDRRVRADYRNAN